eukprot:5191953-Pleurochrysis_carterae.AAC.4
MKHSRTLVGGRTRAHAFARTRARFRAQSARLRLQGRTDEERLSILRRRARARSERAEWKRRNSATTLASRCPDPDLSSQSSPLSLATIRFLLFTTATFPPTFSSALSDRVRAAQQLFHQAAANTSGSVLPATRPQRKVAPPGRCAHARFPKS